MIVSVWAPTGPCSFYRGSPAVCKSFMCCKAYCGVVGLHDVVSRKIEKITSIWPRWSIHYETFSTSDLRSLCGVCTEWVGRNTRQSCTRKGSLGKPEQGKMHSHSGHPSKPAKVWQQPARRRKGPKGALVLTFGEEAPAAGSFCFSTGAFRNLTDAIICFLKLPQQASTGSSNFPD